MKSFKINDSYNCSLLMDRLIKNNIPCILNERFLLIDISSRFLDIKKIVNEIKYYGFEIFNEISDITDEKKYFQINVYNLEDYEILRKNINHDGLDLSENAIYFDFDCYCKSEDFLHNLIKKTVKLIGSTNYDYDLDINYLKIIIKDKILY